jgi:hypothetical protein
MSDGRTCREYITWETSAAGRIILKWSKREGSEAVDWSHLIRIFQYWAFGAHGN